MSDQIPGDGALYPEDFTIPDDTDEASGMNVNPAFEALANRTEFLRTHGGAAHELVGFAVNTDYVWTVPAGVYWFWIYLLGGGGGGGCGSVGTNSPTAQPYAMTPGGGGGGGAEGRWHLRACAPGMLISLTIGLGGLGATVASAKADDGGYTLCTDDGPGLVLGAYGGSGGQGGPLSPNSPFSAFAPGGGPCVARRTKYFTDATLPVPPQLGPGDGGYSAGNVDAIEVIGGINRACSGQLAHGQINLGHSTGGTIAPVVSSYNGGFGGGGGGSSTDGAGGNGGNGGTANAVGTGGAGTNGSNAAKPGAGGGGGGGGGSGSTGGGANGNGGNGADGYAAIFYPNPLIEVP